MQYDICLDIYLALDHITPINKHLAQSAELAKTTHSLVKVLHVSDVYISLYGHVGYLLHRAPVRKVGEEGSIDKCLKIK